MKNIYVIFILVSLSLELMGQPAKERVQGVVSFVSSQNTYVQFKSTDGISAGDTLFILSEDKLIPALKVTNLSSSSCSCTAIPGHTFSSDQVVYALIKSGGGKGPGKSVENAAKPVIPLLAVTDTSMKKPVSKELTQKVYGSLSASAYSNFSNTVAPASTRLKYSLSLDAKNIADSKLSFKTYMTFSHKPGSGTAVKNDVYSGLKIYDLSLSYDFNKTTHLSIGREISANIASLGAMDGIHFEKAVNRFALGAVAGFRPDYSDYGFNSNLVQYGAYVAYNSQSDEKFHQTSLAFMEQMNNSKTDRRFLYFQHTNMLVKNVYLYGSMEADLYKVVNSQPQSTFDLTALYLSLRYNLTSSFSITGSYDSRKNVIYYETYKSLIDSVINYPVRQSYRLQMNYRLMNNIMLGVQSDYRYLKTDPAPAINVNGYMTIAKIPGINVSSTLSATWLETSYLKGTIYEAKLGHDLAQGKVQLEAGYQFVDYRLTEGTSKITQNIAEFGFYWQIARKLSFSVTWEGTFEKADHYNWLYVQLRKRF